MLVVYFSGISEYTHRFAQKLNTEVKRIPLHPTNELLVDEPYLLLVPSYARGTKKVPPQVVHFLNNQQNRSWCQGIIGTGNTNFNADYCISARLISEKLHVPILYMMELSGLPEDVERVNKIIQGANKTT